MFLDFTKIKSGTTEQPVLRLRTLAGKELGVIPFAYNVKFDIKYADESEITFDVPYQCNGMINPLYGLLSSFKEVYTKEYGIYLLTAPKKSGDGVSEIKTIHGYSREHIFFQKNLYLEEGTYNLWDSTDPDNTILGRIIDLDRTWRVGYVAPIFENCYRTFEEYNGDALSFCYNTAPETYQCTIVFDVYEKTINVYDANTSRGKLPIYLSYENLIESTTVDEVPDEIATKLAVYGSDNLSINNVNPLGTDYIIDLSYFIENGDLDIVVDGEVTLAQRVKNWQSEIDDIRSYYTSLVAMRASKRAARMVADWEMAQLEKDLETLTIEQSAIIQKIALEKTDEEKKKFQDELDGVNDRIKDKQAEIDSLNDSITGLEADLQDYFDRVKQINDRLSFESYFSDEEQKVLNLYLVDGEITEETFVATDVDDSVSGVSSTISGAINISGSKLEKFPVSSSEIVTISGGAISIGGADVEANIVNGTVEFNQSTNDYILAVHLGSVKYSGREFDSGTVVVSGKYTRYSSDISTKIVDSISTDTGSWIKLEIEENNLLFTVNVNDVQQYSVEQELYDFGKDAISQKAWPTYEFTLDSANFLFQKEFAPYKDSLELGKAAYMTIGSDGLLLANIIGISFGFDDPTQFTITLSNRFQEKNGEIRMLDAIKESYSSSRSFDAGKYIYNKAADKTTQVSAFMNSNLVAARNAIVNAEDQTILINGAGIHIGGKSKYQVRIIDNMIAMTDDNWEHAKLAIGLFASELGEHWGVNADLLAGKLIIGNSLVLENPTDDGYMQFKVDQTGAWLYNSRYIMQDLNGGLMMFDPKYGIVAGDKLLFDTNGTVVTPEFLDAQGDIEFDSDGMPKHANFFIDIRNGNAYFRGHVNAGSGSIGGWTLEDDKLYGGSGKTYVALNSSGSNNESSYAIWAGGDSASSAPFWVKRNGDMRAKKIYGSMQFAKDDDSGEDGWLYGCGISVGGTNYLNKQGNFIVDGNGNVTMKGSIVLDGNITWGTDSVPVRYEFSSDGVNWHTTMQSTDKYRRDSLDGGATWGTSYQFRGTDGRPGSDASVTRANIVSAMLNNIEQDGLYTTVIDGVQCLGINATAIKTGEITFGMGRGGFTVGYGNDGSGQTTGAKVYGSDPKYYLIATERGVRMTADEDGNEASLYVTSGKVISNKTINQGSDRRLKDNIDYDLERYEKFYMSLRPAQFMMRKYPQEGYHIGFIAQDVEASLYENDLNNSDFAGLSISEIPDGEIQDGLTDKYYRLGYTEFIAMNTYMVQLSLREIQELKAKIAELEARLSA